MRWCFLRKKDVRFSIQKIVIILSFPPFTYLFKKAYDLSIAIAVLLLKRVEGVLTIYLRRGVAKNEIVYGLSDIDLSVILDDRNGEEQVVKLAKRKVTSTYKKLSCFIPLFGRAEDELGVYSTSEFFRLYTDNNSFKYRFNEGRHTWKLLFGKDLVRNLPDLQGKELYLPATEELKVWWPLVNIEFAPDFAYPQFKRKDLWYKAISEVSKVYLLICHGENIQSRGTALREIQKYLPYEERCYIDKIQSYQKHLTSKEDLILDKLMKLFIELTSKAFNEMERTVYGDSERKTAIISLSYQDLIVGGKVLDLIEKLRMYIKGELEPYLDHVALIPQVEFSPDALYNSDIDSYHIVLVARDFVPVEKLKRVNLFLEQNSSPQSIEPFVIYRNIALSLKAKSWYRCIRSLKQCPLFYSLVSCHGPNFFEERDKTQEKSIQSCLPPSLEETIEKRKCKIMEIMSSKDIYKLEALSFLRFFWGAARTKLLSYSMGSDEIHIPVTSQQIYKMLTKLFPGDLNWLSDLYTEYEKELQGQESEAYHFFTKSTAFLMSI